MEISAITRSQTDNLPSRLPRIDPDLAMRNHARDESRAIRESLELSGLANLDIQSFTPSPMLDLHDRPSEQWESTDVQDTSGEDEKRPFSPVVTTSQSHDSDQSLLHSIDLRQAQLEDEHLGPIIKFKHNPKSLPQDSRKVEAIKQSALLYSINDAGILVKASHPPQQHPTALEARIVIPKSLQPLLLAILHDDSISGHLGAEKSLARLSLRYYWTGMYKDVHDFVQTCDSCQRRNTSHHSPNLTIGQPSTASFPFEKIAIDILGPLPTTVRKNRYCLCVIDIFTRYPIIIPIPNQRTVTVATVLTEKVFCEFGFPAELLSDRGTNFMSELFRELLALFKVRKITTLAYRPQTNGIVERFNHTLVSMISHFVSTSQNDWDSWIPYVLFAFRSSPHSTLGLSPFYFLFAREPRFPIDNALRSQAPIRGYLKPDDESYLSDMKHRFEQAKAIVTHRLESVTRARDIANAQLKAKLTFDIGDLVMRWRPQLRQPKGKSRKLARQWEGPFMVVDKQEVSNTYSIVPLSTKNQLKRVDRPGICPG